MIHFRNMRPAAYVCFIKSVINTRTKKREVVLPLLFFTVRMFAQQKSPFFNKYKTISWTESNVAALIVSAEIPTEFVLWQIPQKNS